MQSAALTGLWIARSVYTCPEGFARRDLGGFCQIVSLVGARHCRARQRARQFMDVQRGGFQAAPLFLRSQIPLDDLIFLWYYVSWVYLPLFH